MGPSRGAAGVMAMAMVAREVGAVETASLTKSSAGVLIVSVPCSQDDGGALDSHFLRGQDVKKVG